MVLMEKGGVCGRGDIDWFGGVEIVRVPHHLTDLHLDVRFRPNSTEDP